tara:strand:- start:1958 stop:2920 length:963 start_codon:yes stop_codon:yes gene_type:complete
MNLFKYLENLDTVDVLLIIVTLILIYYVFSNNFEYYSQEKEEFVHDLDTKTDNMYMPNLEVNNDIQETESVQPIFENTESTKSMDYMNPFDNDQSPVGIEQMPLLSSKTSVSEVVGIMDHTNNMGSSLSDVKNNSMIQPDESKNPFQNILNSSNILDNQMETKSLLEQDKTNGFNGHDSNNISIGTLLSQVNTNLLGNNDTNNNYNNVEGFTNYSSMSDDRYMCTLIHANWCGFCKKVKPHWDKLKQEHHGQNKLNGVHGYFEDYEESSNSDLIGPGKKYEVDGFPTFIFTRIKGGIEQSPIHFNAITYESILDEIKKLI